LDRFQVARVSDYGIAALKKVFLKDLAFNKTPEYCAPEIFKEGAPITSKADVYRYVVLPSFFCFCIFAYIPFFFLNI